jgi:ribosomal protein S18 acetylase RimI-like enzyme
LPDVQGLVLVVAAHDRPAISLYRAFGFRTYGVEPISLKLPDRYVEGEQMLLRLSPAMP